MDIEKMKKILSTEYGINSPEELDEAMKRSKGIDLAIFTMPINKINKKEKQEEQKNGTDDNERIS